MTKESVDDDHDELVTEVDRPLPLVLQSAASRPRTLSGVGSPSPTPSVDPEVDDLSW